MRLLLMQRSLSEHIRYSTFRALDLFNGNTRDQRLTGECEWMWMCECGGSILRTYSKDEHGLVVMLEVVDVYLTLQKHSDGTIV